jgi:hypothetical protein
MRAPPTLANRTLEMRSGAFFKSRRNRPMLKTSAMTASVVGHRPSARAAAAHMLICPSLRVSVSAFHSPASAYNGDFGLTGSNETDKVTCPSLIVARAIWRSR